MTLLKFSFYQDLIENLERGLCAFQKTTMSQPNDPKCYPLNAFQSSDTSPKSTFICDVPLPSLTRRYPRKAALASLEKVSTLYAPLLLSHDDEDKEFESASDSTSPHETSSRTRVNFLLDDSSNSDDFIDDLEPGLSVAKRRGIVKKRKRGSSDGVKKVVRKGKLGKLDREDLELVGLVGKRTKARAKLVDKKGVSGGGNSAGQAGRRTSVKKAVGEVRQEETKIEGKAE